MAYRVQKWGNSNAFRIPKLYLEAFRRMLAYSFRMDYNNKS